MTLHQAVILVKLKEFVLLSSSTDVTKFYSCWKGNMKTGLWLIENREISGKIFV